MKEDLLHYLWKFQKFNTLDLKTTAGEVILIVSVGQYLELAGPDFFNAQLIIGNQKWAGNIEIHINSSDWYHHHHEQDSAYENVILHVVWQHDAEIFRRNNIEIPVLELQSYVDPKLLTSYTALRSPKSWIYCENQLEGFSNFILNNWLERLFFERLERKSTPILELLKQTNSDWEAVLFLLLAKNFGLNTNGESFLAIANAIPFSVIRKESFNLENLESLFLGSAGFLNGPVEDTYAIDLQFRYHYLLNKYQLERPIIANIQFFKHRPDNFPTIRLAQLAALYHSNQNLFSNLIEMRSVKEIETILSSSISHYWLTHYQLDRLSPYKKKPLSKSFKDLLIINTIVPLQFAFAKSQGREITEGVLQLLKEIKAEKNTILDKFKLVGFLANNAFESQSLLQLKNEYCTKSNCLQCAIGIELLQQK
jgi:hypothetical protein